jgi:hypothetical protein
MLLQKYQSLENLTELNFWGLGIKDISIISSIEVLKIACFSGNKIENLGPFVKNTKLKELYIRNNCITEFQELSNLKDLSQLRILWLSDNPICLEYNYRIRVIHTLPQVLKLDNIIISKCEREIAALLFEKKQFSSESTKRSISKSRLIIDTDIPSVMRKTPISAKDKTNLRFGSISPFRFNQNFKLSPTSLKKKVGLEPNKSGIEIITLASNQEYKANSNFPKIITKSGEKQRYIITQRKSTIIHIENYNRNKVNAIYYDFNELSNQKSKLNGLI